MENRHSADQFRPPGVYGDIEGVGVGANSTPVIQFGYNSPEIAEFGGGLVYSNASSARERFCSYSANK